MRSSKPFALAGLKVLDFTAFMSGPLCTRLLADCGAEVVKVEPPEGDPFRLHPPMRGGQSAMFAQLNCGKSSIVLDLRSPADGAAARTLAGEADVLVENFRPGVMKRLGLDADALLAANPRLVYCSISGFGQSGPLAGFPAYAPTVHAACGYDDVQAGYQDGEPRPANSGVFLADAVAACNAFGAIQLSLYHRERSGRGQHIDVALADGMLAMLLREVQDAQLPAAPRRHLFKPLRTLDGHVMVTPASTRNCEALCAAVGHPEWMTDPRFATLAERVRHWDAFLALVETWTRDRTAVECEALLIEAGVPASRYRRVAEILDDPHYVERGSFGDIALDDTSLRVINPPFKLSAVETRAHGRVPTIGADTGRIVGPLRSPHP
jgi:crotonobetainyl-CoA:carnitine CoA-transferase CaiB-like acyl-CoA transferase